MGIFLAVFLGLGLWGYYDAAVKYPARGLRYAQWAQWQYLGAAINSGYSSSASVPDPVAEFSRLSEPTRLDEIKAANAAPTPANELDQLEFNRHRWLRALKLVGSLRPAETVIDDPRQTLKQLDQSWKKRTNPQALTAYDIPVQWLITLFGFGCAAYMLLLFAMVARKRYTFDPESLTLTLPDGRTIVPTDIDAFDKRKWHRFIVFLKLTDAHETLGSKEVRLDLLRYAHLEDWVKQMFKAAHPDEYRASFPDEFAAAAAEQSDGSDPEQPDEPDSSAAST